MSGVQQQDFYQVLRVRTDATLQEIDRAYRALIQRLNNPHYEQSAADEPSRREHLVLIQEAYNTLSSKERRGQYDKLNGGNGERVATATASAYSGRKSSGYNQPNREKNKNRKRHNIYEDFFEFTEKPFDLTPDPKYLYLSPKHKEVLAHLVFGLQENSGFLMIVGEVGTGKTLISRSFIGQLHNDFNLAYIFNPCLNSVELLQSINAELGIRSDTDSRKALTDILNEFLLEERKKGNRVVVIVDEAQNLDPQVLEQLRLLSNLETNTEKLIQIVLIGQPELQKLLAKEELRQLRQRITIQWELLALNRDETRGYIEHRLNVAMGRGKVRFLKSATHLIYKYSQGIPRMINVLADRSLLIAYTMNTKRIGAKIVHLAARDIGGLSGSVVRFRSIWKSVLSALALGGLLYFGVNHIAIPELGRPRDSREDITKFIRENPLDLSKPGALKTPTDPENPLVEAAKPNIEPSAVIPESLPAATPETAQVTPPAALAPTQAEQHEATTPSATAKASDASKTSATPDAAPAAMPAMAPPVGAPTTAATIQISQPDKLVTYLSSFSLAESKVIAARWVLGKWGLVPGNLIGLNASVFAKLEADYHLQQYELNGNLNRLVTLDYPAILEISLPNALGTKYLALTAVKGNIGVFGSVDRIEMPLAVIESLWTHKAIIFWKNFEKLPSRIEKGFKGKEAIWVQKNLRLLGFFKGEEAPQYGRKTIDAVSNFQRRHGIADDGKFNTESQMMLYNLLTIYNTPKLAAS